MHMCACVPLSKDKWFWSNKILGDGRNKRLRPGSEMEGGGGGGEIDGGGEMRGGDDEEEEEEEETGRLGQRSGSGGHLERDETWRAVELDGWRVGGVQSQRVMGGGPEVRVLGGLKRLLGSLCRALQERAAGRVSRRTCAPWRLPACSFSRSVRSRALAPTGPRCLLYLAFTKPRPHRCEPFHHAQVPWVGLASWTVRPVSVSRVFSFTFSFGLTANVNTEKRAKDLILVFCVFLSLLSWTTTP